MKRRRRYALLGAPSAYDLYKRHQARNIRGSSTIEFATTPAGPPRNPSPLPGIVWPAFGFDDARLHAAPDSKLVPPYRVVWTFRAGSLLEFPFPDGKYSPVVDDGDRLYLVSYIRLYGMVPR